MLKKRGKCKSGMAWGKVLLAVSPASRELCRIQFSLSRKGSGEVEILICSYTHNTRLHVALRWRDKARSDNYITLNRESRVTLYKIV